MLNIILQALPIIGGLGQTVSNVVWIVALLAAVAYYSTPIWIAFMILFYELLLRFDMVGSMAFGINTISRALLKFGGKGISILPSNVESESTKQEILRIENPLNMFLQINRSFLYFAFFLSLTTLFPFTLAVSFPVQAYVDIFSMMNLVIIQLEPVFLSTLLIVLVPLDKLIDVFADIVKFVK